MCPEQVIEPGREVREVRHLRTLGQVRVMEVVELGRAEEEPERAERDPRVRMHVHRPYIPRKTANHAIDPSGAASRIARAFWQSWVRTPSTGRLLRALGDPVEVLARVVNRVEPPEEVNLWDAR